MKNYESVLVDQLEVGMKASISKTVTERDVEMFAIATGDYNPAHTDDEYAAHSFFKKRVAHGMLGAGLISAVLGMKLPGAGTIYLGQEVKFVKPIYMDDEITAEAEVLELIPKKNFTLCRLATRVYNQDGDLLVDGVANVIPPSA